MNGFNDAFASLNLPSSRLRVVGDTGFLDDTQKPVRIPASATPQKSVAKSPENPPPKPPCIRCSGSGQIPMVARGRKGGNAGGVVIVRCPVCHGTGK